MAEYDKIRVLTAIGETGIVPVFYNGDLEICKNVLKANGTILLSNLDDNTFADAILYINEQLKKGVA
jgi:hypothetical protein